MLKAEIYMWAAKVTITGHTATGTTDLKVAQAALNQIIGKFELLSDFENVFSTSNRNNKEIISRAKLRFIRSCSSSLPPRICMELPS